MQRGFDTTARLDVTEVFWGDVLDFLWGRRFVIENDHVMGDGYGLAAHFAYLLEETASLKFWLCILNALIIYFSHRVDNGLAEVGPSRCFITGRCINRFLTSIALQTLTGRNRGSPRVPPSYFARPGAKAISLCKFSGWLKQTVSSDRRKYMVLFLHFKFTNQI